MNEAVLNFLLHERGNITGYNRTQYRSPRVEGVNKVKMCLFLSVASENRVLEQRKV